MYIYGVPARHSPEAPGRPATGLFWMHFDMNLCPSTDPAPFAMCTEQRRIEILPYLPLATTMGADAADAFGAGSKIVDPY